MYSYTLSKHADDNIFRKACLTLEQHIPNLKKEKLLEDVDGSLIQIYVGNDFSIRVDSDCEVDAVYIDSDIELAMYKAFQINL